MIFIQNNDIEQAKYWVNYLELNIASCVQVSTNYIILFMAAAGASVYIYSLIYSIYGLDFWANFLTICLLIYTLIEFGLSPKTEKILVNKSLRFFGLAMLSSLIFVLAVWSFILLLAFLIFKNYLILVFLGLPFFYLIRFFLMHIKWYFGNSITTGLLNHLLKAILAGEVKPIDIHERIRAIEDMSLKEGFEEAYHIKRGLF